MDYRVRAGEIPEDQTTALMESYSAKLPTSFFLGAALTSIVGSLILKTTGKDHHALFIGQWAAPFLLLGAGVGGYGNEWSVDTWGPTGTLGAGIEIELGGPVLLVSAAYRPMYFHSWVVSSNDLQSGIVHFVGLDIAVEAKDRL